MTQLHESFSSRGWWMCDNDGCVCIVIVDANKRISNNPFFISLSPSNHQMWEVSIAFPPSIQSQHKQTQWITSIIHPILHPSFILHSNKPKYTQREMWKERELGTLPPHNMIERRLQHKQQIIVFHITWKMVLKSLAFICLWSFQMRKQKKWKRKGKKLGRKRSLSDLIKTKWWFGWKKLFFFRKRTRRGWEAYSESCPPIWKKKEK